MDDARSAPPGLSFNVPQRMGAKALLWKIPDESIRLVTLDPEYRSVLAAMKYGNEGDRQKGRASQIVTPDAAIKEIIWETARVLRPSAHMLLWIDKFILGTGQHLGLLSATPSLQLVELISWNKLKIGMGKRARCKSEYLLVVQKKPITTKGLWKDRSFSDCYSELPQKWRHPHAKPIGLTMKLIEQLTDPDDVVVDPFAGGYGTLIACEKTGRNFLGCDLVAPEESR